MHSLFQPILPSLSSIRSFIFASVRSRFYHVSFFSGSMEIWEYLIIRDIPKETCQSICYAQLREHFFLYLPFSLVFLYSLSSKGQQQSSNPHNGPMASSSSQSLPHSSSSRCKYIQIRVFSIPFQWLLHFPSFLQPSHPS